MTARMYYDSDADPSALAGQRIAVLGYGSQGHAHALNLRDSGQDVRVGLPESSRSRAAAEADGLRVLTPAEACAEASVIMVLTPDTGQRALYDEAIAPSLQPGDQSMFDCLLTTSSGSKHIHSGTVISNQEFRRITHSHQVIDQARGTSALRGRLSPEGCDRRFLEAPHTYLT